MKPLSNHLLAAILSGLGLQAASVLVAVAAATGNGDVEEGERMSSVLGQDDCV